MSEATLEPSEQAIREEVRAWVEANWNPDASLLAWRNKLIDSGWGCAAWPKEWHGRGLTISLGDAVDDELRKAGAVSVAKTGVRMLAAATILEHGDDMHKGTFLRRLLTGEDTWCQLFSEPGSGSDLAGLTTRADFDGDNWILNGQKVWTTSAHHAQYGMVLTRTNWDVPKHQGMSYFLIDMEQPGVEVRPLRQMNGHASFNEIFFTDAKIAPEFMLNKEGNGWKVAMTTLAHERRLADGIRSWGRGEKGQGRIYEELQTEVASVMEPYKWYPQRAGRVDLLIERAKATGKYDDPTVRQAIAKVLMMAKAAEWTGRRVKAANALGRPPGPEGSLGKLAGSQVARLAAQAHTLIAGNDALLTGEDGALGGIISEILVSTPAESIAGGTDEIQRNIISERGLGLPKEPRTDVDRPFREVPRNTVS
ncbi:MAG: acyl-CoA dehydrogenase family protein [Gammaproteobacteria bacterium]|nr:acyl-CoA dehydrogenase family protein [Gammaproteobacteria bacterium]MBQ0840587.1 acyl-CoA dehydrogenase family protein [Gammaproteobacteria bacterium]